MAPSAVAMAEEAFAEEAVLLCKEIVRVGGGPSVKFGVLYEDERVEQTFEALLGTLKSARKKGYINFEGELLLKGKHDDAVVSLTEKGEAVNRGEATDVAKAQEEGSTNEVAAAEPEELSNEAAAMDTGSLPPTSTMEPTPADSQDTAGGEVAPEPAEIAAAPEPEFTNEAAQEEPAPTESAPAAVAEAPEPEFSNEAAAEAEAEAPAPEPVKEAASEEAAPEAASAEAAPPAEVSSDTQAAPEEPKEEEEAQESGADADGKKWKVDTSYIDYRTKDPNNLEPRRDKQDSSETAGLLAGGAAAAAGQKTEDGKWKEVSTGYIDHRTKDPNNLGARRSVDMGKGALAENAAGAGAVAPQASATTRKNSDGKWSVDTSYIQNRTGDTGNLDRNFEASKKADYADPAEKKFTYEELKERPKEVDPARREMYLSDAEFQTVFEMDGAAFLKLPKWKQQNLKKAKDLF